MGTWVHGSRFGGAAGISSGALFRWECRGRGSTYCGEDQAPITRASPGRIERLGRQVDRRSWREQRPRQPSYPHSEETSKKKRDVPRARGREGRVLAGVGIMGGLPSRFTLAGTPLFHRRIRS